jgi:hypothetical protein
MQVIAKFAENNIQISWTFLNFYLFIGFSGFFFCFVFGSCFENVHRLANRAAMAIIRTASNKKAKRGHHTHPLLQS